jgi:hypothetical protein
MFQMIGPKIFCATGRLGADQGCQPQPVLLLVTSLNSRSPAGTAKQSSRNTQMTNESFYDLKISFQISVEIDVGSSASKLSRLTVKSPSRPVASGPGAAEPRKMVGNPIPPGAEDCPKSDRGFWVSL